MQKILFLPLLILAVTACNPVDRSSEQPFAPTVVSVAAQVEGRTALLVGEVSASPNSDVLQCGYIYGNDTLRVDTATAVPTQCFAVPTAELQPGDYYAVAYARNGVGTGTGDTLRFTIH